MDTRKIANEYRATHWAQIIQEHAQGMQSVKEYCAEHGFTQNTFYYWQRKLREKAVLALPKLTVAPPSATPSGWICLNEHIEKSSVSDAESHEQHTWVVVNNCWIDVNESASPAFITKIIKAAKEAC